jgi:hypothetical protein
VSSAAEALPRSQERLARLRYLGRILRITAGAEY